MRAYQKLARQRYVDSLKVTKSKVDDQKANANSGTVNLIELDPWEDMKDLHPQPT